MLFIGINSAFKLSFWKGWQVAVFSLVAAVFAAGMYPYAILQSKTQIADYLQNTGALQNMAILVTLESALCFGFCVAYLRGLYGKKNPWWAKLLWWYPGVLIFPVLFYCLTELIFTFVGVPFSVTAYVFAAAVLVLLPALSWLMKYLVPEPDLRLEIHFLVSLFICILGLLSTVNGRTVYAAVDMSVNWNAVGLSLAGAAVLFAGGFVWNQIKFPWLQKKRLKKESKIDK